MSLKFIHCFAWIHHKEEPMTSNMNSVHRLCPRQAVFRQDITDHLTLSPLPTWSRLGWTEALSMNIACKHSIHHISPWWWRQEQSLKYWTPALLWHGNHLTILRFMLLPWKLKSKYKKEYIIIRNCRWGLELLIHNMNNIICLVYNGLWKRTSSRHKYKRQWTVRMPILLKPFPYRNF
jgi:hypothetical protein